MSEERQEAPEVKPQAEHVSLKIAGQGFPDLMIKVKKTTKLQKMMAAYCERAGKSLSEVRFMFGKFPTSVLLYGVKLRGDQNVASLDIDDDEEEVMIEVASEAVGGSSL
ncbi:BQ5605_C023g09643 [Microbotryum silenes-dioicae]|uniref:BQ5605_C023g09643 protein n=1 Tax=Microbotryum silenes-dioicae TaxID=796604 RepID=A0A2X0ML91_9BASI|nr:BQ5605_C023g09643 [Microbotryum silenes-dioicae]